MNDNEVNKIIAEFMEWYYLYGNWIKPVGIHTNITRINCFTKSLDALVPVWEKLKLINPEIDFKIWSHCDGYGFSIEGLSGVISKDGWGCIDMASDGETIQQAAAHTTCKAILELNKD